MSRSRAWTFTVNNPDVSELADWDCEYRIYQLEVGESGTPHFQGYVYFRSLKTLVGVRRLAPTGHWEMAKGTAEQNKHYCSKEPRLAGPYESGTMPRQGQRNDLRAVAESVLESGTLDSVPADYLVRYHRGFRELLSGTFRARTEPPTVYWFWGPTGSGKSRAAHESCDPDEQYWAFSAKWWDGYRQEPTVVIDDLRSDNWPFQYLLRLLDRYPMTVETKGGTVKFNSPTIYITAPGPPDFMYQEKHGTDCVSQLTRRITEVREFILPN